MNALVPGSFDPITLGHVNIIERASRMFDKVYVAVMNNDSAKYDSTLSSKVNTFTDEERLNMVKLSISHIKNAEAVYYQGMLIDACDEFDIHAVIRGVRDSKDFEYEMIHASWNKAHNDRAEALFMPADQKFNNISSSYVKSVLLNGEDIENLRGILHDDVIEYIKNSKY